MINNALESLNQQNSDSKEYKDPILGGTDSRNHETYNNPLPSFAGASLTSNTDNAQKLNFMSNIEQDIDYDQEIKDHDDSKDQHNTAPHENIERPDIQLNAYPAFLQTDEGEGPPQEGGGLFKKKFFDQLPQELNPIEMTQNSDKNYSKTLRRAERGNILQNFNGEEGHQEDDDWTRLA